MTEREEIEKAIAELENMRASLGSAAVEAAQAGLRGRLDEINNRIQEETREKGETLWSDERKPVTILFADISGFTALTEKTDPEIVRGLINACFSRLVPIIQYYEGTVEKFIGDEIMTLFGAPVAHENDAERGVLAALEMMKKIQEFNAEQGTDLGLQGGLDPARSSSMASPGMP
jgi:class 3 adenylate cyclase